MGRMRLAPDFKPTKKRACQVGRRQSPSPPCTKRKYKAARPGPVLFGKLSSGDRCAENTVRLSKADQVLSARRKLTQAEMKDGLLRSVLVASIPGVTAQPLSPRPSRHTNQRHVCDDGEAAQDSCPFERFECWSFPAHHTQSLLSTPKCSPLSTHAWSPPKVQGRKRRASAMASPRCNLTAALKAAGRSSACWDPAQSGTVTTPPPPSPFGGATLRMPLAPASAGEENDRSSSPGPPPARALWHQNTAVQV